MRPFLQKNGFDIYVCLGCGLRSTDLKQEYETFVSAYYSKGYFTGEKDYGAYADYQHDKKYITKNLQKFLTKIKNYKKCGTLLDVGCAMGYFVELANNNGFDAYGFDASEYAIAKARELTKNKCKVGTIQAVKYPAKSFDVITLFDVVEHLSDPIENITKLVTLLKDDGIIVIATGNTDSLAAKVLKRRWTFYTPPQHLHFFTPKTMVNLLHKCGLYPVVRFGVGKWLSLRYILNLARSNGESRFAQWLYAMFHNLRIGEIPLYLSMRDNMVFIVKKIPTS